jgi:uncharacterized protein YaiI (UPF0178 family)
MNSPTIWVDADACPKAIKDILFRAAERTQIQLTLIANQEIAIPPSRFIAMHRVAKGFDVADNEIIKRMIPGDLVITGDIPLAAEVIANGGEALNPRGEAYTKDNIRARLNMRDFMETLRASGLQTGGPPSLGASEKQAFANHLDGYISRMQRAPGDAVIAKT